MKILFSIAGLEFGGSEVFMLRITKMLAQQHEIILLNTRPDVVNEKLLQTALDRKVRLINTPSDILSKLIPFFKKLNSRYAIAYKIDKLFLKVILKYFKIDILCSFKYESDVFICSALETYNIPIVISTRGCYSLMHQYLSGNPESYEYFNTQTRKAFLRANGLVWLTQKNIDILKTLHATVPDLNIQIYNGYQSAGILEKQVSRDSLGIAEDAVVFGMVARGIEEKGWKVAIEGFVENQKENSKELHLILVGDGEFIAELKKQYASDKFIHFVGKAENVVQYITLFDVAVLPTWFAGESIPNSVVEYLYCNKPVIATNWVEIPAMLSTATDIAGFVVSITREGLPNQKEFTECMKMYIQDKTLIEKHSKLAMQAFEKFSMELCAEKYLRFFQNVKDEYSSY
ncbi:MAG: glycosyltransferase family 4 protein [Cytophaga sp.]|uniref:glycosyltransferase family 4 protein n=1 Tax=Cytophaga sp. TaxID=29535 RepID=UPI003F7F4684